MDFIKKQGLAFWISIVAVIISIIAFIIYLVNGAMDGYFKGSTSGGVVTMSILAIMFIAGAMILSQFKFEGTLNTVMKIITGALLIAAAVFLIAALLMFVSDRIQGLSYIYGPVDESVKDGIQTTENMNSASTAVTGFIFYGIAWLFAVIAPFFALVRKVD